MSESMTPAAWYADPVDPVRLRYWDGSAWTGHLRAVSQVNSPQDSWDLPVAESLACVTAPRHSSEGPSIQRHTRGVPPRDGRSGSRRAGDYRTGRVRFLTRPTVWLLGVLLCAALWAGWQSAQYTSGPAVVIVPQSSPTPGDSAATSN